MFSGRCLICRFVMPEGPGAFCFSRLIAVSRSSMVIGEKFV